MRCSFFIACFVSFISCQVEAKWCDPGFRSYKDYCFQRLDESVNKDQAVKSCSSLGASLFEIETWEDQRTMEYFMEKSKVDRDNAWLNAIIGNSRRTGSTYEVYWPKTRPNVPFRLENFGDKEELQKGMGMCLVMQSKRKSFYWKRLSCYAKAYAICVKKSYDENSYSWN